MSTTYQEDVSSKVLQRMKEGGFDFARVHAIEFYAVFLDREQASKVAGNFRGECVHTQVSPGDEGGWELQVSRVMHATFDGITAFQDALENLVEPLGGQINGWGVTHQVRGCPV